jgi:hypothetical protein
MDFMVVQRLKLRDIKLGADDFKYYTDLNYVGIELRILAQCNIR